MGISNNQAYEMPTIWQKSDRLFVGLQLCGNTMSNFFLLESKICEKAFFAHFHQVRRQKKVERFSLVNINTKLIRFFCFAKRVCCVEMKMTGV